MLCILFINMLLVIGLTIQLYAYCFLQLLFNLVKKKKEKVYAIMLFFCNNLHSYLYLGSLFFCLSGNICILPLQLTLECHGFELQRSIYMWIFFSCKYYSTDSLWLVESADVELQIWRSHVVIGWFFDLVEGWCPQVLSCSRVNCVLKDSFLYTTLRICHPTAFCPSLFLMISWFLI